MKNWIGLFVNWMHDVCLWQFEWACCNHTFQHISIFSRPQLNECWRLRTVGINTNKQTYQIKYETQQQSITTWYAFAAGTLLLFHFLQSHVILLLCALLHLRSDYGIHKNPNGNTLTYTHTRSSICMQIYGIFSILIFTLITQESCVIEIYIGNRNVKDPSTNWWWRCSWRCAYDSRNNKFTFLLGHRVDDVL